MRPFWVVIIAVFLISPAWAGVNDGLIGYWTFDDGTAKDLSGNGNNGILQKGVTTSAGKVGVAAMRFDGVDDSISLPSINFPSGEVSLSAWINTTVAWQRIFSQGSDNFSIQLFEGQLRIIQGGFVSRTVKFNVGQWTHVTVTCDAKTLKIYLNGVEVLSQDKPTVLSSAIASAYLGAGGGNYFAGSLDEVRLYKRLLSAEEVVFLYKSTAIAPETIPPSVPENLVASQVKATQVTLSWAPSTDNNAVDGYKIYRDGVLVGTSSGVSFVDSGLAPTTRYTYSVLAYDIAYPPNDSASSTPISIITTAMTNVIIEEDRKIDWKGNVGIPNGVPIHTRVLIDFSQMDQQNKYNVHPNDGIDDAPGLTKAIADASQASLKWRVRLNENDVINVVYLPAGSYDLRTTLLWDYAAGVLLKGEGTGKTILLAEQTSGGSSIMTGGNPDSATEYPLLSGYEKGSTLLTTDNVANLVPGMILDIYQDNDPDLMWSRWGAKNLLHQKVVVTKIDAASKSVEFEPPLAWPPKNWNSSAPPMPRFKYGMYSGMRFSGMEDLSIKGNPSLYSSYIIWLTGTYAVWLKGVEVSHTPNQANIVLSDTLRTEIRDSYIHDTYSDSDGYGIVAFEGCSALLIENNVFETFRTALIFEGTTASVVAYNYSRNARFVSWPDKQVEDFNSNHGPHGIMTLWEGNVGAQFMNDGYHGSTSHQTLFRNYFTGEHVDPLRIDNVKTIDLTRYSYDHNVIGNVLGNPHWPAVALYEATNQVPEALKAKFSSYKVPVIYRLGYPNLANNSLTAEDNLKGYDPKVSETLLRHGNFDYQTKSTIWDPNVSNHVLPASLYQSSQPSWWPSQKAWPPIGPDVQGMVNKIPAQICYEQNQMPNCLTLAAVEKGSGDVSGDGKVTMYDAALALRYSITAGGLTQAQIVSANMDGNKNPAGADIIDNADVMAIVRRAVGL